MNREEIRDQLYAPMLQWSQLGREYNAGLLAACEVITQRSYGLLRGHSEGHDWKEMGLMLKEKVAVPLEGLGAMASVLPNEMLKFWTRTGEATVACVSGAATLAGSRSIGDFKARTQSFGDALVDGALAWYQISSATATVLDAGLSPLIRQVKDNAKRLS